MSAIKTRLIHVAHHAAGEDLAINSGYGGKNARVTGVVPLGLGDGMRNPIDGQSLTLLLRGRRVPVLGVSLEHTTLDLTAIGAAEVGDEVTVIGAGGNSFKDLARAFGCSELEAVMTFSGQAARDEAKPSPSRRRTRRCRGTTSPAARAWDRTSPSWSDGRR